MQTALPQVRATLPVSSYYSFEFLEEVSCLSQDSLCCLRVRVGHAEREANTTAPGGALEREEERRPGHKQREVARIQVTYDCYHETDVWPGRT